MVPTFNTADEGREGRGSDQAFVNWWEKVCPGISAAPGCERDGGRVVLPQPEEAPVVLLLPKMGSPQAQVWTAQGHYSLKEEWH